MTLTIADVRRMREHMRVLIGFRLLDPFWGAYADKIVRWHEDHDLEIVARLDDKAHFYLSDSHKSSWEIVWLEDHA